MKLLFPYRLARCGALAALASLALALPSQGTALEPPGRVVAIGDIHGDYPSFLRTLQAAGLADESGRWAGGDATLVQTGDFTDRGVEVRAVMDLLMALQQQAPQHGGKVAVLLGNHEVFNLMGEYRDVAPDAYANFADERSEDRRREAFERWAKLQRSQADWRQGSPPTEEEWMAAHPPGFLEYAEAMSPQGEHGRWVRTLPVSIQLGDTIFLHGGISPELAPMSIEEINRKIAKEIETYDRNKTQLVNMGIILPFFTLQEMSSSVAQRLHSLQRQSGRSAQQHTSQRLLLRKILDDFLSMGNWLVFRTDGPLWFRGYAQWTEEEGARHIAKLLETYRAEHFVVGHTAPRRTTHIQPRFDSAVFLIDTGMNTARYGGRGSALEILDGRFTAIYQDAERAVLLQPPDTAVSSSSSSSHHAVPAVLARGSGFDPRRAAFQETGGAPPGVPSGPSRCAWRDPDGEPLPFTSPEEVELFLRTARIVSQQNIPVGVTKPSKVLLERNGVRAHAVFHSIDELKERVRLADGTLVMNLRDSYKSHVAAYELSRLMGMDGVPPVVEREVNGKAGSLQLWIENAFDEIDRREKGLKAPNETHWKRQLFDMNIWDNLVNNIDRNLGNVMMDQDWNVCLIDHTRTFGREKQLPNPERVGLISRDLFESVRALDEKEAREVLKPYMGTFEISAFLARRKKILEMLDKKIAERGEDKVVFSYGDPDAGVGITIEESEPAMPGGEGGAAGNAAA